MAGEQVWPPDRYDVCEALQPTWTLFVTIAIIIAIIITITKSRAGRMPSQPRSIHVFRASAGRCEYVASHSRTAAPHLRFFWLFSFIWHRILRKYAAEKGSYCRSTGEEALGDGEMPNEWTGCGVWLGEPRDAWAGALRNITLHWPSRSHRHETKKHVLWKLSHLSLLYGSIEVRGHSWEAEEGSEDYCSHKQKTTLMWRHDSMMAWPKPDRKKFLVRIGHYYVGRRKTTDSVFRDGGSEGGMMTR